MMPKWMSSIEKTEQHDSYYDFMVTRDGASAVVLEGRTMRPVLWTTSHYYAVQEAIERAYEQGGGIIRIKGTLEVDQPVVPRRNVKITGTGDYYGGLDRVKGDVIRAKTKMDAVFDTQEYVENFVLERIAIDGNGLASIGFRHTQGYRVQLVEVEIARVLDKGISKTGGGELFVSRCRINAVKDDTAPRSAGIEALADDQIVNNIIRGFRTGIIAKGSSLIELNHIYGYLAPMEVGIEVDGPANVKGNYVDNYTVCGIKIAGSGPINLIGNRIRPAANLGSPADVPHVLIDYEGEVWSLTIVANIMLGNAGTTVQYAIKVSDAVTGLYKCYVGPNIVTAGALSNKPEWLKAFHAPVAGDCSALPGGKVDGEVVFCYDTASAKVVMKVWYQGKWHTVG